MRSYESISSAYANEGFSIKRILKVYVELYIVEKFWRYLKEEIYLR
jgi:hypothetical protein